MRVGKWAGFLNRGGGFEEVWKTGSLWSSDDTCFPRLPQEGEKGL